MEKSDKSFLEYAVNQSDGPHTQWLRKVAAEFQDRPVCGHCQSVDVEIIVDPKIVGRCRKCGNFSSNIDIDKVQKVDYNAVTLLHKEKIKAIIEAQEQK